MRLGASGPNALNAATAISASFIDAGQWLAAENVLVSSEALSKRPERAAMSGPALEIVESVKSLLLLTPKMQFPQTRIFISVPRCGAAASICRTMAMSTGAERVRIAAIDPIVLYLS